MGIYMPNRKETLQSKILKKISPNSRRLIPSPVIMEAKNEITKRIQRTFRNKNRDYKTYRKGSKMTTNAMKRQLIKATKDYDISLDQYLAYIKNFIEIKVYDKINDGLISEDNKNNEEVELLLDSLNREMIVDTYNLFFGVKDQEEDLLTLGWEIVDGGSKKTKK